MLFEVAGALLQIPLEKAEHPFCFRCLPVDVVIECHLIVQFNIKVGMVIYRRKWLSSHGVLVLLLSRSSNKNDMASLDVKVIFRVEKLS